MCLGLDIGPDIYAGEDRASVILLRTSFAMSSSLKPAEETSIRVCETSRAVPSPQPRCIAAAPSSGGLFPFILNLALPCSEQPIKTHRPISSARQQKKKKKKKKKKKEKNTTKKKKKKKKKKKYKKKKKKKK